MFNTLYRQELAINLNYLILRKSHLLMIKVDQLHHQAYTRISCYFWVKISLYSNAVIIFNHLLSIIYRISELLANWIGNLFLLLGISGSAPRSNKSLTIFAWPWCAEIARGVHPLLSRVLMLASKTIRSLLTHSKWLLIHAKLRRELPFESLVST